MTRPHDLALDRRARLQRAEAPSAFGSGTVHPGGSAHHGLAPCPWSAERLPHPAQPPPRATHQPPSTARPMLRAAIRVLHDTRRVWREPLA